MKTPTHLPKPAQKTRERGPCKKGPGKERWAKAHKMKLEGETKGRVQLRSLNKAVGQKVHLPETLRRGSVILKILMIFLNILVK